MRQFIGRLDKVAERIIEIDPLIIKNRKVQTITLKVIFDNLRGYITIGALWAAINLIGKQHGLLAATAVVTAFVFLTLLAILLALQTSAILVAGTYSLVMGLLPPKTAVRLRRSARSPGLASKLLILALILPVLFGYWTIMNGLIKSLTSAGV